jgi:hypothetical protein
MKVHGDMMVMTAIGHDGSQNLLVHSLINFTSRVSQNAYRCP